MEFLLCKSTTVLSNIAPRWRCAEVGLHVDIVAKRNCCAIALLGCGGVVLMECLGEALLG